MNVVSPASASLSVPHAIPYCAPCREMATQVLDALHQMGQPLLTPQMMGPHTAATQEAYPANPKPAASSTQMLQVTVEVCCSAMALWSTGQSLPVS